MQSSGSKPDPLNSGTGVWVAVFSQALLVILMQTFKNKKKEDSGPVTKTKKTSNKTQNDTCHSQAWWCMPVNPTLEAEARGLQG